MSQPIVVTQQIDAPPDVVYAYLTESAKWAKWQGEDATVDARPGGIFVLTMPNGTTARGQFIELVPDQKVVLTWGWVDHPGVPPGSSTVEIEITSENGGSLVTLTHRGVPDEERELHTQGWEHYLPRLASVAQGGEVDRDRGPR